VTQIVVPPPKYHVDRLVPEAKVAPEARLTALAIIQRGGVGDVKLDPEEALEILLSNCEDAYGFPPYSNIERFLHSRNGQDLKQVERDIIAKAFHNVPATLVRSETMDWWQRVPAVVNGNGTAASEKDELSALGR
jgi:dolichol-phosphate mannosyltransferase